MIEILPLGNLALLFHTDPDKLFYSSLVVPSVFDIVFTTRSETKKDICVLMGRVTTADPHGRHSGKFLFH